MTGARAEILRRIRTALGPDRGGDVEVPRGYRSSGELTAAARLDLLAERLADYGCTVRRVPAAELATAVPAALAARGVRRVAVPPGIPAEWLGDAEAVRDAGGLGPDDLDRVDGVLTGCAVAIAETGTLVLDGSPDQGRRALSLVPDYHLCVVRADAVVGTVPEALARLVPTRPLTFISGPSATSDIELDRVEGVHGPRTLDVLLLS